VIFAPDTQLVKKINRLVVALSLFLGFLTIFTAGSADATLTFRTPVALSGAQVNFQDVIGPDGYLYTADYSGYVFVNSGVDGSPITSFRASNQPILGLAIDASGNIWVSGYSSYQNTSISEFTSSGTFLKSIALQDTSGGYAAGSAGLALSPSGNTIYELFDNGNVFSASTSGTASSTPLFHANLGSGGSNATSGIAVDSSGNIWVTSLDRTNQLWQYSSTGALLHTFTLATLPEAIAVDQSGNVWVASINGGRAMYISELTPGSSTFVTAGQATNIGCPAGLTVGLSGNLWISDVCGLTIQKVIVTAGPPTFAVSYSSGYDCYSNCSGNSGTLPATQSAVVAGSTFILPANPLTYAGHTFVGWNDGTTTYQPGATYTMGGSGNVTLSAQWIVALPTTSTTTTTVPPAKKTITCVKGASTKKVTALNPVCPAGYKKK